MAPVYDRFAHKTEEGGVRELREELLADADRAGARDRRGHRAEPAVLRRGRLARRHRARTGDAPPAPGQGARAGARRPRLCRLPPRICPSRTRASTSSSRRSCSAAPIRSGRSPRSAASCVPGGRLLFLEHVRSDDPDLARFQDRMNWLNRFLVGCSATGRRSRQSRAPASRSLGSSTRRCRRRRSSSGH